MAGLVPARISGGMVVPGGIPTWLTPISANLLHGSFAHLALTMTRFYYLVGFVERFFGGPRFLLFNVIDAYAAGFAENRVPPDPPIPLFCASGGVYDWKSCCWGKMGEYRVD